MKFTTMLCAAGVMAAFLSPAQTVVLTESSTSELVYSDTLSDSDLINAGRSTLSDAKLPPAFPAFPSTGLNDGEGDASMPGGNVFFPPDLLPAVATFELNLGSSKDGYDITSIRTIAGWGKASQSQANQKYKIRFRKVGTKEFITLKNVDYSPFDSTDGETYESLVTITNHGGGVLASRVAVIQFEFEKPSKSGGKFAGSVYREIDVLGRRHVKPKDGKEVREVVQPKPIQLSVLQPVPGQVIPKNAGGRGAVIVRGNVDGPVSSLEARVALLPGATNTGFSTDWVFIGTPASDGSFSGRIPNVNAGGWYRVDVRATDAANNVVASGSVEGVRVGEPKP